MIRIRNTVILLEPIGYKLVRVDPAEIVMFQHAVEQKVGKVLRGSGYFLVETEIKGIGVYIVSRHFFLPHPQFF